MNRLSCLLPKAVAWGFLFLFVGWGVSPGWGATWRVGMGRENITPQEPIWMSGYASRDRPATGTRTELWAKAMVFEDGGGERGAVLSLDVVGFGSEVSDRIYRAIEVGAGLERSQVLINASHTHTGPVVGENLSTMYFLSENDAKLVKAYTQELVDRAASAVIAATNDLREVSVWYETGQARFGVNRRNNPEMLVAKLRFEGQLRGPVDYSVPVLRITDPQHRTIGILFGYACHATTLNDYQWSGDYPGYAQQFLEARYPGVMAQFLAGCGADINPLPRRAPKLAVAYGAALADSVGEVLSGVMGEVAPELGMQTSTIELSFNEIPDRAHWVKQGESDDRYIASRARKWLSVIDAGGVIPESYPYPMSWWRMGDSVNLVGLGGEVVVEYSLGIKERFGEECWVAGYSHDVMAYIPSRRIWLEGGYEGNTSMIYYGQPDRWTGAVEEIVMRGVSALAEASIP